MSAHSVLPFELSVWMYHYVRDPGDAAEAGSGIPGLPVARFTAQIDELARYQHVVGWPAVQAWLLGGPPLPPQAVLLTFDDGLRDHYLNVYPLLKEHGLSGLFFALARPPAAGLTLGHKLHYLLAALGQDELQAALWRRLSPAQQGQFLRAEQHYQTRFDPATPQGALEVLKATLQRDLSSPAEGLLSELFAEHVGDETATAAACYLQPAQVREMAAGGMHFGGHSASHPWFDFIGAEEQAEEIAASAAWLAGIELGPWAFAYPYGGLSAEAPRLLAERGFAAGFTTKTQLRQSDPYFIGRLDGEEIAALSAAPRP
jgi:peptidoglycan/xylan/chitin deacetylase (PgdA/CDA1 family)